MSSTNVTSSQLSNRPSKIGLSVDFIGLGLEYKDIQPPEGFSKRKTNSSRFKRDVAVIDGRFHADEVRAARRRLNVWLEQYKVIEAR